MGCCTVTIGESSKRKIWNVIFGGHSRTYELGMDRDHLERWSASLLSSGVFSSIEVGPTNKGATNVILSRPK